MIKRENTIFKDIMLPSFTLKKCRVCGMIFFESDGGCPNCKSRGEEKT